MGGAVGAAVIAPRRVDEVAPLLVRVDVGRAIAGAHNEGLAGAQVVPFPARAVGASPHKDRAPEFTQVLGVDPLLVAVARHATYLPRARRALRISPRRGADGARDADARWWSSCVDPGGNGSDWWRDHSVVVRG